MPATIAEKRACSGKYPLIGDLVTDAMPLR